MYHFQKWLSFAIFCDFDTRHREITIHSLFGSPCIVMSGQIRTHAMFVILDRSPPTSFLIGTTALHMAVRVIRNVVLRMDLVQFLLGENVDPSPRIRKHGHTPLHVAVSKRQNIGVIELLVGFGADVNARYLSEILSPFYIHKNLR